MAVGVRIASWNVVAIRMRYVTASTAGVNAKTASTVHLAKTVSSLLCKNVFVKFTMKLYKMKIEVHS